MLKDLVELRRQQADLRLSASALQALTDRRLRALVRHCYDRVPYYRLLLDEAGVDPDQIRSVADLERIPVSTKQDLRRASEASLLSRDVDLDQCGHEFTSGSTGEPFKVYLSEDEVRRRRMVQLRSVLAVGMKPWDRLAVLGPVRWRRPGLLHRLGIFQRVNIPPLISIEEQIDRIRAFRPSILWAYPGALHALLDRISGRLEEVCQPRMLITSAETPDRLLQLAGEELPSPLFNFYGSIEAGRIAWECPAHEGLHVNVDQAWLEIRPVQEATSEPGLGEVIVTALNSRTMPFLRYRLGDLTRWLGQRCSCGLALPLIEAPRGRLYSPIQLPSGAT
ncbi:MAG: hypothetical protein WBP34_15895, partial [Thermoanaerobaculia bacterium]